MFRTIIFQSENRSEKFISTLPACGGVTVSPGVFRHRNIFRFTQKSVDLFDHLIGFSGSSDVKEISFLCDDPVRLGSPGKDQIRHFSAFCKKSCGDLFRIDSKFILHISTEGRDITAGSGTFDPFIVGKNKSGHSSAAGLPIDADTFRIDFRTAEQIIYGTDPVISTPIRHCFPNCQQLTVQAVVCQSTVDLDPVEKLIPFSLLDGVD